MQLNPRNCPICGSEPADPPFAAANVDLAALDDFAFASRKLPEYMHWRLAICRPCDLLFASPAPSPEDLGRLYRDAAFDSGEVAGFAAKTYGRLLRRILHRLPDQIGAVDIGTGDGVFLKELLDAGFREVAGIEPSSAPIAAAAPEIRPLIHHGLFHPDSFPSGSQCLITCFQTIEHLPDPLGFCRDAARGLKPGGALFLVGHNRRALSAKILGKRSPIFDIEHLQLFSPASMRRLLESAGLTDVRVVAIHNRYPLNYWARLFPFPSPLKTRLLDWLSRRRLGRLMIPLPAGNMAAFGFRPQADAPSGPAADRPAQPGLSGT